MCVRRGDETEYKFYRSEHADGRWCGAPSSPALATSFLSAVKQEAFQSWPESYGITCGNILWRSSPGSICQTASVGVLTSTTSVCFLNTFFFLPGYVAAQAKVYKFLPLRSAHCSGFRVFHDHSLPAGDSLMRFWVSTARPCLLFSTLDPRKNNTWLVPSLESPHLLGFAHRD